MDPEYERWLRNDVAYLHSLWHRGPPHPPPPPLPPPPTTQHIRPSNYIPPSQFLHYTSNPTQFKKEEKIQRKKYKSREKKANKIQSEEAAAAQNPFLPPSSSSSGIEWPTSTSSPATISGWSTTWPQPDSQTRLPSPAEKAAFLAAQAQAKSLKSVKEFFDSDDDNDDEDDDDDDGLMEKEEYRFFLEVFMEDRGLREYYEKNYSDGEFSCLLCLALKKRYSRRKYKDCAALVQHTISVSKKRMGRAHRAYGQAICKVLGWDIAKLPKIVSALSVKCEPSLTNLGQNSKVEDRGKNEDAQANVGEGRKDGLSGLERKEDQMNVSNSGQSEENGCEGTSDALPSFQSKEGSSVDIDDSGQREVQSDGQANISEGNYHDLTDIGNKEAIVDTSDGRFPVKEFVDTTNLLSNGESVVSEPNSLARPEASKGPADLSQAVPEIMENKEAGQLNGGESPKEE